MLSYNMPLQTVLLLKMPNKSDHNGLLVARSKKELLVQLLVPLQ